VAKEIIKKIKLQVPAGKATPAPPVGTALGPAGINIQEFCTKFNDATKDKMGDILPVEINVYEDRSFDFKVKTPPATFLLKKAAGIEKASTKGANEVVSVLTEKQIEEIAETKLEDLNAYDLESAKKIIAGTARNMGIAIKGVNDEELAEQQKEAFEQEKEMLKREAELNEAEARLAEEQTASEEPAEGKENKEEISEE
jgi:large subunit ribosomal protein L11